MMYVQQHTTTRSIKRQPTQLVELDEQDHIIRLTLGAMTSRHRSIWLDDDVIWSAVAEIPLDQLAVPVVKEKHGDLDKAVCASTPSTPKCEEYARRRIIQIGGNFKGIFIADSRELNIHPITPAQVD